MPAPTNCIICNQPDQPTTYGAVPSAWRTLCVRCGNFDCDRIAAAQNLGERRPGWVVLSGFVREQNAAGIIPLFTNDLIRSVVARPLPRLPDRAMRLLTALAQDQGADVERFRTYDDDPRFLAVTYSAVVGELDLLIRILAGDGLFERSGIATGRVSPAGYIRAEELAGPRSASPQAFVAMWFDASMNAAYTSGFDRGIRTAGYRPIRIDNVEHAGPISDAILAEIRRSRFVVADYTGANNGVYFEAGFAIGLGIPVIATCRADEVSRLHFDIRHINTLLWDNPEDLAPKLTRRISAVLGDGPLITGGT